MSKYKCSLLVVDDEPYILATLAALLNDEFEVITSECAAAAQSIFAERPIDLVLTDQKMPKMSGVQLLEWVRQNYPKTIRLMMTGYADLEEAVEAINRGQVYRYLPKPWRTEDLLETLHTAARNFLLERSHEQLLDELREVNDQLRRLNADLERRVMERTHDLKEANQALEEAIHELEQKNKMLEKLALTDPLTGLSNRRAMDRLAEREIRRRDRYPNPFTLGLVDVDHFKQINARYLLPGGDKVLVDLARVMRNSLRDIDLIGRIGGEEFLILAPDTGLDGAKVVGERLRSTVEQAAFVYKDEIIPVHISVGFAVAEEGVPADYESLKHLAAAALSDAKNTGRNRCVYHTVPNLPFEQAG